PNGQVIADVVCRKCAYNLRGLNTSGRCPECGTSVGFSIQGDYLRFCDPSWVDTLRLGVVILLSGIGVIVLAVIVSAVQGATRGRAGGAANPLGMILSIAGYALMVGGAWLLTTPDPS